MALAVLQANLTACIASKLAPTMFPAKFEFCGLPQNLWEQACLRWHHCGASGKPHRLHREQARSHRLSHSNLNNQA